MLVIVFFICSYIVIEYLEVVNLDGSNVEQDEIVFRFKVEVGLKLLVMYLGILISSVCYVLEVFYLKISLVVEWFGIYKFNVCFYWYFMFYWFFFFRF